MGKENVAYPFTKSLRARDKIMSEVMISTLVKSLSISDGFIIEYDQTYSNVPREFIVDGYYFYLSDEFVFDLQSKLGTEQQINTLYFYTTPVDIHTGDNFPELYHNGDDHNCLFTEQLNLADATEHTVDIWKMMFKADVLKPYFIAEPDDVTTREKYYRYKIWIKKDTMNPYVYDDTDGSTTYNDNKWIPLGAVYKSTL